LEDQVLELSRRLKILEEKAADKSDVNNLQAEVQDLTQSFQGLENQVINTVRD
jgi:polyhydroxyalkanoate synthesis regulator phasin